MNFGSILHGLLGLAVLLGFCWLCSAHRSRVNWRLVLSLLAFQIFLGVVLLTLPGAQSLFRWIAGGFVKLMGFTLEGAKMLLGPDLGSPAGHNGFVFLLHGLPTIIFVSALTSLLYYLNVLQRIVYAFAWILHKVARISGAESLSAAANVFVGQTEAPLVVKPYIGKMTRSEIMCLMTGGMATIAGSVLALYIGLLGRGDPAVEAEVGAHLLIASVLSAPAAILVSKLLVPETEEYDRELKFPRSKAGGNALEAICLGTTGGVRLCVNVAAMLLVFTALVYLANALLSSLLGDWTGLNDRIAAATDGRYEVISIQFLLGYLLAPLAWLLGVHSSDLTLVGQLLGEKTVLNEFYAYMTMSNLPADAFASEKSRIIAIYALCGFANFASVGIQIGGIGTLAPERRTTLAQLGMRSLVGGTVACLMTACIAGMLIGER